MKCRNHPDEPAVAVGLMPAVAKQRDGSYVDNVPLCSECAPRIEKIGFAVTALCCHLHKLEGCCDTNDCGPCCNECPTCPTLARMREQAVSATSEPEPVVATDEDVIGVIAEHLMNLFHALVSSGIDGKRCLGLASSALVRLDTLAAEERVPREYQASPAHGKGLAAVIMLTDTLGSLTLRAPTDIEPSPLLPMFAQALEAIRVTIENHWQLLNGGGGGPTLHLPTNGSGR